jgi:heme exporter protein D
MNTKEKIIVWTSLALSVLALSIAVLKGPARMHRPFRGQHSAHVQKERPQHMQKAKCDCVKQTQK